MTTTLTVEEPTRSVTTSRHKPNETRKETSLEAAPGPKLASALGVEDVASCPDGRSSLRRPKMYGHRGSIYEEPENTIRSFQKALNHGVEGVELDVFRLRSGEIAVFHGDGGDKLPGGLKGYCGVDGSILDLTAEEARELGFQGDAHVCPEEKLEGAQIPMLEEVSVVVQ